MKRRCEWAGSDTQLQVYHDREWGVPQHDDRMLFEQLIMQCMQAGLSWLTVLKKRDNLFRAFDGFDPLMVARYDQVKVDQLLHNPGIIRNKSKIQAAISNAGAFIDIQNTFGSFDLYLWRFVDGVPIRNERKSSAEIPAHSPESIRLSKDLKQRGFSFVGPTICYAYMQAVGMVNDHLLSCFRYHELNKAKSSFTKKDGVFDEL